MIQTANKHSTTPRLVIVSSEVHHWVNIEQEVIDSPDMFKTLGSKEYCIAGYASIFSHSEYGIDRQLER